MQTSLFEHVKPAKQMILRACQVACIAAIYAYLAAKPGNPCAVVPTGGGKSLIIANVCRDAVEKWQSRVIVLTHVKELLEQLYDSVRHAAPNLPVGLYSAGLGKRDLRQPIIIAGIQSVYQRAFDFAPFDLVIIDEAQLIPPDGEGMYRTFLADLKKQNPHVRLVGLTATPYRMKSGSICTPDGLLNEICYEIGVRELIDDGHLSPVRSKNGLTRVDLSSVSHRGGEFNAEQMEAEFDRPAVVKAAVAEILGYTADRKSVLIFTSGEQHAQHVVEEIKSHGFDAGFVGYTTPDAERARLIEEFREGRLKYLVNINVLTIGFDAPCCDAIALLRATESPGLYYQMVGRGFRLSPQTGKTDCLVLDFGGNALRHGPVDCIKVKDAAGRASTAGEAPAKECPSCHSVISAGYGTCPDCGHVFADPEKPKHEETASDAGIISGETTFVEYDVFDTYYAVHKKRNAEPDAPKTMRVDYLISLSETKSEWICIEHDGFAKAKAERWWAERSPDPMPSTAQDAVDIADGGGLARVKRIRVKTVAGEKFPRIVGYEFDGMPEPLEAGASRIDYSMDDIPF
jgi:DNA repair protein RadD